MRVHVADHPLITHKLTVLRDKNTPSPVFRHSPKSSSPCSPTRRPAMSRVEPVDDPDPGHRDHRACASASRKPLVVPDPARGARHARGHGQAACRPPRSASSAWCATKRRSSRRPTPSACRRTSPTASASCSTRCSRRAVRSARPSSSSSQRGAVDVTAICLLGSPRGPRGRREGDWRAARSRIVLGALDERLNEHGYIVPGLGDAGDRLYGTV